MRAITAGSGTCREPLGSNRFGDFDRGW
jgi:hypothetical protein